MGHKLMSLDVFGSAETAHNSDIISAICYADNGAEVINMSVG